MQFVLVSIYFKWSLNKFQYNKAYSKGRGWFNTSSCHNVLVPVQYVSGTTVNMYTTHNSTYRVSNWLANTELLLSIVSTHSLGIIKPWTPWVLLTLGLVNIRLICSVKYDKVLQFKMSKKFSSNGFKETQFLIWYHENQDFCGNISSHQFTYDMYWDLHE